MTGRVRRGTTKLNSGDRAENRELTTPQQRCRRLLQRIVRRQPHARLVGNGSILEPQAAYGRARPRSRKPPPDSSPGSSGFCENEPPAVEPRRSGPESFAFPGRSRLWTLRHNFDNPPLATFTAHLPVFYHCLLPA